MAIRLPMAEGSRLKAEFISLNASKIEFCNFKEIEMLEVIMDCSREIRADLRVRIESEIVQADSQCLAKDEGLEDAGGVFVIKYS